MTGKLLLHLCCLLVFLAPAAPARALLIQDPVGLEAVGGVGIELTLTQGFENGDWFWVHSYDPIALPILEVTLRIDLIDADDGFLDLYADPDGTNTFFGTAVGVDQGSPPDAGTWRDLQSPPPVGAVDNEIVIPASLYADIADGEFQILGINRDDSLGVWGSNRAILTIVTAVPEPSTALLVGAGLVALCAARRRGPYSR